MAVRHNQAGGFSTACRSPRRIRAGATGLEAIEAVIEGARRWLREPDALVVKLAPPQAGAAVALALEAGFSRAEVRPDLAGRPRALVASVDRRE